MVDRSAMPVIYPLPDRARVTGVRARGRIEGMLRVPPGRQGQEKFDDYAFRVGLVEPGERTLNFVQRRVAARWVRKLFELAPRGSGISRIYFFNVGAERTQIGRERQHPLSDLIWERGSRFPAPTGASTSNTGWRGLWTPSRFGSAPMATTPVRRREVDEPREHDRTDDPTHAGGTDRDESGHQPHQAIRVASRLPAAVSPSPRREPPVRLRPRAGPLWRAPRRRDVGP